MSSITEINSICDAFYNKLASALLEDDSMVITPEKLGEAIGVSPKQLINAVWNGTMDIGWGHRGDLNTERRHTVFSKVKVWRYFYGKKGEA